MLKDFIFFFNKVFFKHNDVKFYQILPKYLVNKESLPEKIASLQKI